MHVYAVGEDEEVIVVGRESKEEEKRAAKNCSIVARALFL